MSLPAKVGSDVDIAVWESSPTLALHVVAVPFADVFGAIRKRQHAMAVPQPIEEIASIDIAIAPMQLAGTMALAVYVVIADEDSLAADR